MYDIPLLAFIFLSRASSRIILDGKHIIRSNNTSKASNHQHKTVLDIRRKIADGNDDYLPHNRVYGLVKAKEIGETSCHSYSCKWGSGRKGSTGKPQIVFRHFMTTTPQVL